MVLMKHEVLFGAQVRAGRALLGWSQAQLSERSGVSRSVLAKIEAGTSDSRGSTLRSLTRVLEEHGIVFVELKNGEFGVHLKPEGEFE